MKKRIAFDVDGVVANFTQKYLKDLNRILSIPAGQGYTTEDLTGWGIDKNLELDLTTKRLLRDLVNRPNWCRGLWPMHLTEMSILLQRSDLDIYFVTSSWKTSPTWDFDRAKWLYDNFLVERDKIVFTSAKHTVSADIFVDDRPENVIKWKEHNPEGVAVLWGLAPCYEHSKAPEIPGILTQTGTFEDFVKDVVNKDLNYDFIEVKDCSSCRQDHEKVRVQIVEHGPNKRGFFLCPEVHAVVHVSYDGNREPEPLAFYWGSS